MWLMTNATFGISFFISFLRPSGACLVERACPHGLRRGLNSFAALRLFGVDQNWTGSHAAMKSMSSGE
jgi:hypothetical protein